MVQPARQKRESESGSNVREASRVCTAASLRAEKMDGPGGRTAPARPRSERKNVLFPRNGRPYDLKHNAFKTENVPEPDSARRPLCSRGSAAENRRKDNGRNGDGRPLCRAIGAPSARPLSARAALAGIRCGAGAACPP